MALSLVLRSNNRPMQCTGLRLILLRAFKQAENHKRSVNKETSSRFSPETKTTSVPNKCDTGSLTSTSTDCITDGNVDPDRFGSMKDAFIEPSRLKKRQVADLQRIKSVNAVRKATDEPIRNIKFKSRHAIDMKSEAHLDEIADESDVFGTLDSAPKAQIEDLPTLDQGDREEEEYLSRKPQLWRTTASISLKMKALIREHKLGEALNLLQEMTTEARIKPDAYMYNVLIGGCGRAGYTKMAFKLYRKMKDRQLQADGSTYTGLFNACANSPWPEDGLNRASKLYQEICEKGIALNNKNYHAAIKAFGRCGNLQMAFQMVDMMKQNGVGITCETFNFLLSGCASEQATGFLHAIRVWKKMRQKKIRPDIYSYNLLLRTIRHCSLGDPQVASKLLLPQPSQNVTMPNFLEPVSDPSKSEINSYNDNLSLTIAQAPRFPDLLSPKEIVTSVTALQEAATPQDRLLMLGGMAGILHRMDKDNVHPQINTFTELLELIPSNSEAEELLLGAMKDKGISPDVDFFNVLIKRRNSRNDFNAAKEVLDLIARHSLHVDIATFGTLALGCTKWDDAKYLLNDMEAAGFRANIEVMGALVHKACGIKNFWYLMDMLKLIHLEAIPASPKLLTTLEKCVNDTKHFLVKKEKQGVTFSEDDKFFKSFKIFLHYYKTWLKNVKIQLPDHQWDAYRTALPMNGNSKK